MTTYRAEPITQRDGSEDAGSNCRMASAATGIDYHTLGGTTSTGAKMRERSGDPEGGTTSDDAERAWDSYSEQLRVRDGGTWDDAEADLKAGRLVMLDIWAAEAGGPCLSGSGAYGHTIAVAPEQHSDGRWLVADPWCSPPTWKWWGQKKLREGAEEWGRRCGRSTAGLGYGADIRHVPRPILAAVVRFLMTLWTPEHPAELTDDDAGGETGGAPAIMYTTSAAHSGGSTDMAIDAPASLTSGKVGHLPKGTDWYADAALTDRRGTISADNGREVPYVGRVIGKDTRAVVLMTGEWSDDGDEPVIVYVDADAFDPEDREPE